MHNSLAVGAIIQRRGTRNTGHVVWTEILRLFSVLPDFLLTVWILHVKLRYGQANTLCLPSLLPHSTGSVCDALYRAASGNAGPLHLKEVSNVEHPLLGSVLEYHWSTTKKQHKHSRPAAFKRQEFSLPGQLCGKAKHFQPGSETEVSERVGKFPVSAGFLTVRIRHPVQGQCLSLQTSKWSRHLKCVLWAILCSAKNSDTQGQPSCAFLSLHSFPLYLQSTVCQAQRDRGRLVLKWMPPCFLENSAWEWMDDNCPDSNSDQMNSISDQILVSI